MQSLVDLRVSPTEVVRASHWNSLLAWLRSAQILAAPGVRVMRTPNGTMVTATPVALPARGAFAVSVGSAGEGQAARVSPGMVEGIVGSMGVDAVSLLDDPAPALPLPDAAGAAGEGYIYLRISMTKSWYVERSEVIFSAVPLAAEPWLAHKLVAILRADPDAGTWSVALQVVHFNLGHYAYGRKPSGIARHLFFAR